MGEIRKAQMCDLDEILKIYENARRFMAENGNPNQWKNVHPPKASLIENINEGKLYVISEHTPVDAVFFCDSGPDPTYEYIEGAWINDNPYYVLHRIASSGRVKSVVASCVDFALKFSNNIRIDTHADNKIMQKRLSSLGFIQCGTIYVEGYGPMLAYQLEKTK